jgi:hypothetical protein
MTTTTIKPLAVEKKAVRSHRPGAAPLSGFVTYIHPTEPVLMRRLGWEVSNDIHDDFSDIISRDNGRTWSEPRRAMDSKTPMAGGFLTHTENAALYVPDRDLLIHFTNDKFEPSLEGGQTHETCHSIRITVGDPESVSRGTAQDVLISDFGMRGGMCVSFAHPMLDSSGRVLIPVQGPMNDPTGALRKRGFRTMTTMPDVLLDIGVPRLLIGEFQTDGKLNWRLSQAVPCELEKSSRGLCEPAIAELPDGRFFMVMRGSNAAWPDRPGYKWLTFSSDRGETWTEAVPLPADDGSLIESSATGSALFRSIADGKLYWIGNLCLEGQRPVGNMPRSPLYVAQMQEDPVAIKRDTIAVIDRAQPGEHVETQHSNFKFYQDRATGEVVLYLTRYGERGYADGAWLRSDEYQYRFSLEPQ